jgi:protein-disulfide isomerase-like protein with CxxC motif
MEAAEPDAEAAPLAPAAPAFAELGEPFLRGVQDALEALGYDLTSDDAMAALAADAGLAERLLPALLAGGAGGGDAALALELVRRWQEALAEQVEADKEAKRRRQRPVWRCGACGRYGCPVMPYIERFVDLDEE